MGLNTFLLYIHLLINFFVFNPNTPSEKSFKVNQDNIKAYLNYAKDSKFDLEKRKEFLRKAYRLTQKESDDSLRNSYLLKISFRYYRLNDSLHFRKLNQESVNLSKALKDSSSLAANYWDLGGFYSKNGIKDSAYYVYAKAQKIYDNLGNEDFAGRMLLSMAIVQSDVKDFTGSEITTIKAIAKLKPLNKYEELYRCYNNLAISFNNLGEFDDAIENHKIALEYQRKIKRKNTFKENTLNNIGVVYKNKGNYSEAIEYYRQALSTDQLEDSNLKLYAMLLDNLAYSKFKIDHVENIESELLESLRLRDSIKDYMGIAVNKLHLAEYYIFLKDSIKAKQYALEANVLSLKTNNFKEYLSSLLILAKLDKNNNVQYMSDYIKLNDSLRIQERALKNKFTRIQFQTNEFIVKNKRLSKQKETILAISILILSFGILIYVIRSQSIKNKTLLFEKEQQKANEDIYNLMITQQNKLDEGSKMEKKRISEELHDGILGKLFGTRLILSNLNHNADEDTVQKREKYINDLQKIEEEIRDVSHELNEKSNIATSNIGYETLIKTLLSDQSTITYFNFEFKNDERIRWQEMPGQLKMNLYRIIQETTQNINKHAKAKNVFVEFRLENNNLVLEIKDDGVGFNQKDEANGIGLQNVKSRAKKFNGKVDIISVLKEGTSIKISIPNA